MRLVRTGRHQPHEVLLLVFSILGGLAFLLGADAPSTLERALPAAVVTTWRWSLLVSGTLGLVGCYWRGYVVTGLLIERGAMLMAAATGLLYIVALFSVAGLAAVGAGIYTTAYAVACIIRAGQISRDLRLITSMQDTI